MIQSAEEFAYLVRGVKEYPPQKTGEYIMQQKDYAPISQGAAIELIRSRDKAIIERTIDECKYILRCDAETLGGNGFEQKSKGLIRGALLIEEALDSVLRELSE